MKTNACKKMPQKKFVSFLFLFLSLAGLASDAGLLNTNPVLASANRLHIGPSTSEGLVVDIYTDKAGQGQNVSIGTYTVGDQIRFYVSVNQNCSITLELITPDGSAWIREVAPISAGTFVDYVEAQYPTGAWKIVVIAQQGSIIVTETAPFVVVDKAPITFTRTSLNATTIEEALFEGKIVQVYMYPVGGVYGYDVLVDRVYFGPDIRNLTVMVQWLAITFTLGYPPGYVDTSIALGDRVEVYGLVNQKDRQGVRVTLNGSENYYIKKLSTLYYSPEILLFTREVFSNNLTVRINGIALPGSQNTTITSVYWNWGDGLYSDQRFPATHAYARAGTYVILIKAFQSDGLSTTKSLSISVQENTFTETSAGTTPEALGLWTASLVGIAIAIVLGSLAVIRFRKKRPSQSNNRQHA